VACEALAVQLFGGAMLAPVVPGLCAPAMCCTKPGQATKKSVGRRQHRSAGPHCLFYGTASRAVRWVSRTA